MLALSKILLKIKNRRSDDVLKHSVVYAISLALITLINILFRKYVSSTLSIAEFGVFTAIFALVAIVSAPFAVFPLYISKLLSGFFARKDHVGASSFFKKIFLRFFWISFFGFLLFLPFSSKIRQDYRLHSIFPVLLALLICQLQLVVSFFSAAMQSFQSFVRLSIYSVIPNLIRIAMAIVLFELIYTNTEIRNLISGYNFAIVPGIIGHFVILIFFYRFYLKELRSDDKKTVPVTAGYREILRELLPMAFLMFLFGIMRNIDEYFARAFLNDFQNGLYGSIISVGKSSMFMVTSLVYVLFPKLSASVADRDASRRIMIKGMVLAIAGFLAVFGIVLLFPEMLIRMLTHAKYLEGAAYLGDFFIAYLPYSLIFVFVNFFLIHRNKLLLIGMVVITALQIILLHAQHGSISRILLVMGIVGYATLAFVLSVWWYYYGRPISPVD